MANTKNRPSRVKDEDVVIYKIMAAMVIVAAVICVLIVLYNKYQVMDHFLAIYNAVFYLAIIGGIGGAVCLAAAAALGKVPKARKVLAIVGVCLLILAVSCVFMRIHTYEGIQWLFIIFPAGLVLYILHLIYQPEFFLLALEGAVSGISFYLLYRIGTTMLRPWVALVVAAFLVVVTALNVLAGNDGVAKIGKLRLRLYQEPLSRIFLLITSGLCIAGWLVAVLAGGAAAVVCAGILLLWLIVMACYYTIKLV